MKFVCLAVSCEREDTMVSRAAREWEYTIGCQSTTSVFAPIWVGIRYCYIRCNVVEHYIYI